MRKRHYKKRILNNFKNSLNYRRRITDRGYARNYISWLEHYRAFEFSYITFKIDNTQDRNKKAPRN